MNHSSSSIWSGACVGLAGVSGTCSAASLNHVNTLPCVTPVRHIRVACSESKAAAIQHPINRPLLCFGAGSDRCGLGCHHPTTPFAQLLLASTRVETVLDHRLVAPLTIHPIILPLSTPWITVLIVYENCRQNETSALSELKIGVAGVEFSPLIKFDRALGLIFAQGRTSWMLLLVFDGCAVEPAE